MMRTLWAVVRFVKGLPWQFQRRVLWLRDGYDPEDIWSLDSVCARWLAPRLEGLRDHHCSHPWNMDPEVWFAVIDKMAQTMRFLADEECYLCCTEERQQYIDEGLALFAAHFQDLWD